jgi:uncharacterized protein YjiS (DUF1127 family)
MLFVLHRALLWRDYYQVLRELDGLSEFDLRDLGVTRAEISFLAWSELARLFRWRSTASCELIENTIGSWVFARTRRTRLCHLRARPPRRKSATDALFDAQSVRLPSAHKRR